MDTAELATARRSLHAVAELVLAGPQYRATGKLRLRVIPGGYATTTADPELRVISAATLASGADGALAGVADVQVVRTGGPTAAIDGQTAAAIGAALGVQAARPDAYPDGAGVDPGETLRLDPEAADAILRALAVGQDALVAFAPRETPVLWPEHFDVAIRVGEVNYGLSPGDGFLGEPYAYVGVARRPDGDDAFWNAPFGAAVRLAELGDAAAVSAFFAEGRDRAA